jgi:uncharacterized protein (TIGR03435 family)
MRARNRVTSRHPLTVITALSFLVIDLGAQTTQNTPSSTGPTFDVISIKPHAGDPNSSSMRPMPGGGIILVNGSVRTLIGRGYPGLVSEPVGLPAWATSEQYDVNATASLKNPTIEDRQAMMRALLAERFKFAAHLETQEQPSFDLVLARNDGRLGPGLKPSEVDCAARAAAQRAAADAARAAGTPPPPPPAFSPPTPGSIVPPCNSRIMGNAVEGDFTMASLASLLRSTAGRYVVDKTGLTGSYRVKLEGVRFFQGPGLDPTAGAADELPSIFTALQEQLGLKLESSRARVEVLVIDHIERPSEN